MLLLYFRPRRILIIGESHRTSQMVEMLRNSLFPRVQVIALLNYQECENLSFFILSQNIREVWIFKFPPRSDTVLSELSGEKVKVKCLA